MSAPSANLDGRGRPWTYRFEGVGAPEGEHAYFRGLYLGDERGEDRSGPEAVLEHLRRHTDVARQRGSIGRPEDHPDVPIFGNSWTTDPALAHQFALDPQHGHYRSPRLGEHLHTGAVVEVHSTQPPRANGNEFEGSEVRSPSRDSVTRAYLHVHRMDTRKGAVTRPFPGHPDRDPVAVYPHQQDTLLSTTRIPLGYVRQATRGETSHVLAVTEPYTAYEDPRHTYLRFGDWPEHERSRNNVTGHPEEGVSAYHLDRNGEPIDPDEDMGREHVHDGHCEPDCDLDSWNEEYGNDTHEEMVGRVLQARRTRNAHSSSRAHLVTGTHVGFGHDAEPLVRDVERVGHWPCDLHRVIPGHEQRRAPWCDHEDHDNE